MVHPLQQKERHESVNSVSWREWTLVSIVGLLVISAVTTNIKESPLSSAETRFVEVSASGLQVVPASCPSDPANPDYPHNTCSSSCPNGLDINQYPACECPPGDTYSSSGGSGGGASCIEPTAGNGTCVMIANPNPKYYSQSSTLSWSTGNYSYTDPNTGQVHSVPPSNLSISPTVGSVAASGSATVNQSYYTTYTLTGDYVYDHDATCGGKGVCGVFAVATVSCSRGIGVYYCDVGQTWDGTRCQDQCSGGQTWDGAQCTCPSGATWDGNQCVGGGLCTSQYFCSGSDRTGDSIGDDRWWRTAQCAESFSEACTFGCYNGQCLAAPMGTMDIRVTPSLVRTGEATTVTWTAESVSSCYVDENNATISDTWSGAEAGCDGSRCESSHQSSGITQQTRYTLHCTGLNDETYTDTATVNILPVFNEI